MAHWDPIFKAGTHTSSTGATREWSVNDLDDLVRNTVDNPPIVIHHPADQEKSFNFGKISRLKRIGKELMAQYHEVPEILSMAVKEGLKLAKSVSIDPEAMKIRHVGLLGAGQPPAVDGLGAFSFSTGQDDSANNNEGDPLLTYMFNQLESNKEGTVDPKDLKIKELEEKIKGLETDKTTEKIQADLAHAKEELRQEKEKHETVKTEFSKFKQDQEDEKLKSRVDALSASGRIKPADKEKTLAFARALPDESKTMEFSAPDGKSETVTPREMYMRDLEARQSDQAGLLSEFARSDRVDHSKGAEDQDWSKDINSFA